MNPVEASLRQAARDLDATSHRWAVVGGFAVSARSEPRFTRDVDLAVAVANDHDAESLVQELGLVGYQLEAVVEQDATGRLATARLGSAEHGIDVIVDLLFASSGIEPEIVAQAERLEILVGLTAPVATIGHLIAVKLLARDDETRPQDAADLRALLDVATPDDIALAREAVALITERGFHRDRDLPAALNAMRDGR